MKVPQNSTLKLRLVVPTAILAFPCSPPRYHRLSNHDLAKLVNDCRRSDTMLTKYITGVTTSFSPFNARSGKTVRNFLASLPPNARSNMAIVVKMFGQGEAEKPASLSLKFSTSSLSDNKLPREGTTGEEELC